MHACNYVNKSVSTLTLCLVLLQAAAKQRNAVAVLRRLPEFGVALLPAQLTALPDKQQLLHSVLLGRTSSSRSSSRHGTRSSAAAAAVGAGSPGRVAVAPWRRLGDVLELAELLGMGGQEEQQQVSFIMLHFWLFVCVWLPTVVCASGRGWDMC
jgi:hypothetical protein